MRTMSLVFALFVSFGALAGESEQRSSDLGAAVAQQHQIRTAIEAKDPAYNYLDNRRRRIVMSTQDRLFVLADGKAAISDLTVDDQIRVFNELEKLKALLVNPNAPDARKVCERTAMAGTRRQELACYTKDEQDRRAANAKDTLMARPACTQPGCM